MKQLLTHHVLRGGKDPSVVSGHDLVQKGAILRVAEKSATNKDIRRPSLLYADDMVPTESRISQCRDEVLKKAARLAF
eukprot:11177637-Lingulodinium_polyedra.AAC.1